MGSRRGTSDIKAELSESSGISESIPSRGYPQNIRRGSSSGVFCAVAVMRRSRVVLEVAVWSTYSLPSVLHDGLQMAMNILHESGILFGRDCLGYWYYLCHQCDDENCTTYIEWRTNENLEKISWEALLVDGPLKLGQRLYPVVWEFGWDIVYPQGLQVLSSIVELFILLFRTLMGILVTLSPWMLRLLWPDRHYKSARKDGSKLVAVQGAHPCELGYSVGYDIDVKCNANDDDFTTLSDVTSDEAIRSPDRMPQSKDRMLFKLPSWSISREANRTNDKHRSRRFVANTIEGVLRSTPLSGDRNAGASDNKASYLQRNKMGVPGFEKWKNAKGLKSSIIPRSATNLKRSLWKQKEG